MLIVFGVPESTMCLILFHLEKHGLHKSGSHILSPPVERKFHRSEMRKYLNFILLLRVVSAHRVSGVGYLSVSHLVHFLPRKVLVYSCSSLKLLISLNYTGIIDFKFTIL